MALPLTSVRQAPQLDTINRLLGKSDKTHIKAKGLNVFKKAYSNPLQNIQYFRLSDKARSYCDGTAKLSARSDHNGDTIIALSNKFQRAAWTIGESQLMAAYKEFENDDLGNEAILAEANHKLNGEIFETVEKLISQKFGLIDSSTGADRFTGVKRVKVGQIKDLIPEIDEFVRQTVDEHIQQLRERLELANAEEPAADMDLAIPDEDDEENLAQLRNEAALAAGNPEIVDQDDGIDPIESPRQHAGNQGD